MKSGYQPIPAFVVLLLSVVVAGCAWREAGALAGLEARTEGEVVGFWTDAAPLRGQRVAELRFEWRGRTWSTYSRSAGLPAFDKGDRVPLVLHPDHPEAARVARWDDAFMLTGFFGLWWLLASLAWALQGLWRVRAAKRR
jgi:hypothetical protein